MRPRLLLALGVTALAALTAFTVAADAAPLPPGVEATGGFRCDNGRLVRHGESQGEVSRKCGQPDFVNTWNETQTETILVNGRYVTRQVTVTFDEWEYDFGRHRLVRFLTFLQGRLIRVRTGGYGT